VTTEAGVFEAANDAPPLTDQAAFVAWVRRFRGPEHVWVRQEAEDAARRMLDQFAGRMTAEQAFELGRNFNTDSKGGDLRYDRFAPAFHGATMQRVVENPELFNEQVRRLWGTDEDEAVRALDEILRNPHTLPGAGRSLPSMLFYLRDRARFVPWLDATHRGLAVLTGFKGSKRQGGAQAYFAYCEAAWAFARDHGLAPQEIDGVLALANTIDRQRRQPKPPNATPRLPADAFAFLADLRANNNAAWMSANRARYQQSLREPFRKLLEAVAERFIVDLDPELNTTVKTGEVLASIRKRFPDQEGEYYPYYWGAFSRARKQEDVQLYVLIDREHLRMGLTFGSAATGQLRRLRATAATEAEALWLALQPVHDRVQFLLDDTREPIDVQQPADLVRWLNGPTPSAVEILDPTDSRVISEGLVDEIGLVLRGLYPVAALAWGKAVPKPPSTDEEEREEKELEAYPLTQLAHDTLLPIEDLEEWVHMLRGQKRQALLYGPPGTGKTFVAKRLGDHLALPDGEVQLVQFHPSFSYEDFLEGLRPTDDQAQFRYQVRRGVFYEFCERARAKPSAAHVFVIDEINRADLGSVLGELMLLLEYRTETVTLPYSQRRFGVPKNVVVLATMNTADRSLALVDFALRRRFHTIELPPSREVLRRHLADRAEDGELALQLFDLVQQRVGNSDFAPGHAYWMGDDTSADGLRRVWRYELKPYLAEYWFEHPSRLQDLERAVGELLSEGA
jgi:AAA domain (dynein-related subfamily)/Conserved hypothetical protein (DUF2461)